MTIESKKNHLRVLPGGKGREPDHAVAEPTEGPVGSARALSLLQEVLSADREVDPTEAHDALRDIYRELSNEDPQLTLALSRLAEEGLITANDRLYLFVLFISAKEQGGIDLELARDALVRNNVDIEELIRRIEDSPIDDTLRGYLLNGLSRVYALEGGPATRGIVDERVVQQLIAGEMGEGSEVVHQDEGATIYRLSDTTDSIGGIGAVRLRLDYRKFDEVWESDFDALQFRYDQEGVEGPPIARLEFHVLPDGTFDLAHRFVQEEYRRDAGATKGVGTQLLDRAKSVFQQMANETKEPQKLIMVLEQVGVIHWARDNDFEISSEQAELLDRVLQHPEEFVIQDVVDPRDGVRKNKVIFQPGTTTLSREALVRMTFEHSIFPQGHNKETE